MSTAQKNKSHRLWRLISGTRFAEHEIVDYDYLFYNNYDSLIQQFEIVSKTKKPIIIDKTHEHLHDKHHNTSAHLSKFLDDFSCKDRTIVFDNTYDHHHYDCHGINHLFAPFYIFFYLARLRPKIPQHNPNINFNFVCLNNTHKPHRQNFVEILSDRKILSKTKWSYRQKIASTKIKTPKYIDQANDDFDQNKNLESIYNDSLISLITESDFYEKNITHATEKSLWSVFYGCMPIIIGVPGAIDLLRSWSIDVYDDIIDQSYDEIQDNDQRLDAIVKICESMYHERFPEKIKNLIAGRIIRNQFLLHNYDYWQTQIFDIILRHKYH